MLKAEDKQAIIDYDQVKLLKKKILVLGKVKFFSFLSLITTNRQQSSMNTRIFVGKSPVQRYGPAQNRPIKILIRWTNQFW